MTRVLMLTPLHYGMDNQPASFVAEENQVISYSCVVKHILFMSILSAGLHAVPA